MVFVDVDQDLIYSVNQYSEDTLFYYYQNEPIYSMAYYDALLLRISKYFADDKFKILEFGCGSGMLMRRARRLGHDISGLDYSPYSKKAKEMFDLQIDVNEIDKCIYKDEEFDVVLSHATFEHLLDPVGISKKIMNYLKPNGLFIITGVPNFNTITIQVFKNFWHNGPLGHVNHFEKQSVRKLFHTVGLKPILIRTYGWDIWYLQNMVKKVTREIKEKPSLSDKNKLDHFMHAYEDITPTKKQKLLAYIYYNIVLQPIGNSIEAWGKKEGAG
jgi:SAM-dependent methyltransferase